MGGALGKFLSKYGKEYGLPALKKGKELGEKGLTEALGIAKAAPVGAGTIAGGGALAGLGLGEVLGDEEDLEEEDLKKLLMLISTEGA